MPNMRAMVEVDQPSNGTFAQVELLSQAHTRQATLRHSTVQRYLGCHQRREANQTLTTPRTGRAWNLTTFIHVTAQR
ncbi:MAG: hypothetical protein ACREA0_27695, partial [bacterium]